MRHFYRKAGWGDRSGRFCDFRIVDKKAPRFGRAMGEGLAVLQAGHPWQTILRA